MEFYFVFYFFFFCRASPVRVFIIGAVIFLLKNVCFVCYSIFCLCILFLLLFLGISLWLFVLVQALLVSI